MKTILFAGAGSVGKTVLMEACLTLAQERGLVARRHSSSTRSTYAKAGLTKESDALNDPGFNRNFQGQVMADNIAAMQHIVHRAAEDKADVVFADRTPHDYAAYYFSVFAAELDLLQIKKKRKLADSTLAKMRECQIVIYVLPYPCHWSKDTESSDGWRNDTTGKNFVWSSIVENEVNNIKHRLELEGVYHYHITVKRLPPFFENASPDVRALGILSAEFPFAIAQPTT